ncbi:hypothetical protein [Pelomonas cellulosilytica]|uniref:Uncharacterized protein n=1 Tax=Pelomonas cellulosilytica TaxID=2906762 RepID=A0ABS8XX71_9BURK|nr:hypothetical protein [Pelomonas sp. P8]MCE4557261.1 hypothetical protein [Pelomonas sp. P8]
MQFPKSLHAEGWHAHMPHLRLFHAQGDVRSPRERHRLRLVLAVIAAGALLASAGVAAIDDPRPLDQQLSLAMQDAGETLHGWQDQLSRGLQVSLRAVADGRETPAVSEPDTAPVALLAGPSASADQQPAPRGR